jgi:hypothetical protein
MPKVHTVSPIQCEPRAYYKNTERVTQHTDLSANHACCSSVQASQPLNLLELELQIKMILTWQLLCGSKERQNMCVIVAHSSQ